MKSSLLVFPLLICAAVPLQTGSALSPPRNLRILPAAAAVAHLAWDPNSEADLAGYKLYYGTASRSYLPPAVVGNQTNYAVKALRPGTWYFAVTAVNAAGHESGYSNEVSSAVSAAAVDANELIFPHVADGGGYKTVLLLTNGTDTNTTATVSFFTDSGSPLTVTVGAARSNTFTVPVQARGSAKLTTSGTSAGLVAGWVQVMSLPSVNLNGNAIFQLFNASTLVSEASVAAFVPASSVDFYADEDEGFNTGFALANPGNVTASGRLTLRTAAGSVAGTVPISIPPFGHEARFLWEIFPGAPSGRAELNLTQGTLSASALRYHTSSVFSTVCVGSSPVAALFSPNGGVQSRIVAEIGKATSTIDIAIYSFTANEIRDALIAARNRGVKIRIIADDSQADVMGSEIATLEGLGFDLKRRDGLTGGIMHNKYMIIDGRMLLTGSYNWSASAESKNSENAIFIQGSPVIRSYVEDFDRLWNR